MLQTPENLGGGSEVVSTEAQVLRKALMRILAPSMEREFRLEDLRRRIQEEIGNIAVILEITPEKAKQLLDEELKKEDVDLNPPPDRGFSGVGWKHWNNQQTS
ncbi:MAG: hypothetical protein PHO48_00885 [Candidatus Gracilibacteria bacterium]|nr:hypothetical protein [Candidatus Gracilibacteria bacterium]MDD5179497.1 hypothetical protein [Candidatus Gracilibacteria bacterium]